MIACQALGIHSHKLAENLLALIRLLLQLLHQLLRRPLHQLLAIAVLIFHLLTVLVMVVSGMKKTPATAVSRTHVMNMKIQWAKLLVIDAVSVMVVAVTQPVMILQRRNTLFVRTGVPTIGWAMLPRLCPMEASYYLSVMER